MSSNFEEKMWKFTERLAKAANNSAHKRERDLDERFRNGTISDNEYIEQSNKAIMAQFDTNEILEKCRNRNKK